MSAGESLYFAYGSNLYLPRMQQRVASAMPQTVARLPGFRLAFRKRGGDGSTKCDLVPDGDSDVWGMVYRIDPAERAALNEAEGEGYRAEPVTVLTPDGSLDAFTYRARDDWIDEAGWPYGWYRDLVVVGARHHALPASYVGAIASVTVAPDPDHRRDMANRPRPW